MMGRVQSWDAIWDSAGRLTESGYVVEIAVPFASLDAIEQGYEAMNRALKIRAEMQ